MDNHTLDEKGIQKLKEYTEDIILLQENMGFAKANNMGCKYAKEKYHPSFLCVINNDTVITQEDFIERINQIYKETTLKEIIKQKNIKSETIDLKQKPIKTNMKITKELDVGSCDRWNLLYTMLKGSYTEDESNYGNFESNKYEFIPTLNIKYTLETNEERFEIEHKCGFLNNIDTRLIPIQENSNLTING